DPEVAAAQGRQRVAEGDAVGRAQTLVDHVDREAHLVAGVDRTLVRRLGDVHVGAEHGDARRGAIVLLAAGLVAGVDGDRVGQRRREGRTAGGAGADDVDDLVLPGGQAGRADVVERLAAGAAGDVEVSGVGAAADGPGVAATQRRQRVALFPYTTLFRSLVDHVDREAHLVAGVDRTLVRRLGD